MPSRAYEVQRSSGEEPCKMFANSIDAERLCFSGASTSTRTPGSGTFPAAVQCSVETMDPLSGDAWDLAIKQASSAPSVFHGSAWARLLHDTYGHQPHYLCVRRRDRILAFVPLMEVVSKFTGRRGVVVPFADVCPPLWVSPPDHATLARALAFYAESHHWKHLEVRGGLELPGPSTSARCYHVHEVDLARGMPALWNAVSPATRRAIRKAQRAGLNVSVDQSESSIRDYYRLHIRTRKRFGLPPQPLIFFLNLHHHLIRRNGGIIVIATNNQGPVAGAVFLCNGGQAIYKFGASDERFWDSRPNQLVMWQGIQALAQQGITTLGFGRTAIANGGLAHFKSSFAAEAQPLAYRRYRPDQGWNSDACSMPSEDRRGWFCSTPLLFNRLAGACIYKHLD